MDSVTSHNNEQLAFEHLLIKTKKRGIHRIYQATHQNWKNIAEYIKTELSDIGQPISNVVGEGYDGTLNMSSAQVGVQKIIRDDASLAVYNHCASHCLSLVISYSCNLMEIFKGTCWIS